ncbi:hypothetical protein SERLA73DRAFT_76352 [Serpula lacrymans var. lacrymans S7.3]|uniref:Peptidase A1 domain-containing protein n=2 Tax=Serpula lacrymans var. lacrymans TaxID=341189 RepID=F8Q5C2_SERL3|nr:uncharacterized protein SERLADRAFT_410409 [Serpula lacrymans var. lacrymans S7.9]EGN96393.1 hypothetical protein SERLA73DRAFT_76352 [Serpula lacrymans var. lacrymans S7.3]EGO21934.1 hypothetical protein SERLADRAFT_410409 [Serpula lacrymans var. lacrymans S7.9]
MLLAAIVTFSTLLILALALPQLDGVPVSLRKRSSLYDSEGSIDLDAVPLSSLSFEPLFTTKNFRKIRQGYAAYEENTGVVPLIDYHNVWYGNISVGSPASVCAVDFDSAGNFFLVAGSGSTCDGHNEYNPNLSSKSTRLGDAFTSQLFGENYTISGEKYSDTVTIAGYTAKTQNISVVEKYSGAFCQNDHTPHNFIGLAFKARPGVSVQSDTPIIETLVTEVNHELYKGQFTYTSVVSDGFWQVNVDGLNVGGKRIINGVVGLIDTATTVILANTSNVSQFYNAINGTDVGGGLYTLPCRSMPTVSVTLGGTTFALSKDTFDLGPYDSSGETCVGVISAHDDVGDVWVLGDTFLRNVYTVFDVGNARVGYAKLA